MFRVICHLDMDAFYASVEQRDNPAMIGNSVIDTPQFNMVESAQFP